ncbi:unnamed protein product [Cuscuta europaea]|uniref:Uncharacterized protein n=1 Tax=Cuscuta europaea TaxID=41803 RepID=A0A9P0ZPV6_CUSEU|nr:unnamed protein product [Cuscuta europaea]
MSRLLNHGTTSVRMTSGLSILNSSKLTLGTVLDALISSWCSSQENLEAGSLREVGVKCEDEHIYSVRIVEGDDKVRNYSYVISVHPEVIDGRLGTHTCH